MAPSASTARLSVLSVAVLVLAGCTQATPPGPTPAPAKSTAPTAANPTATTSRQPAAQQPEAKPTSKPATTPAFDEKTVAEFYEGQTIRLIVGHSAGGGFDVYSRLIARHIGRHIPGNPNVIVENMTGAGGLLAANYVYNVGPKDGTVIANVIGGIARSQLFGAEGVEFDAAKFQYIGAPNSENTALIVTKASGITKFDQLLQPGGKEVALGDGGVATTNHIASLLVRDVVSANVKVVTGYDGTAKVSLAMEQGEIDGQFNDWASTKARDLERIQSGDWLVVGQLVDRPLKDLPNVPLILDSAQNDEQRQLLRYGLIIPNKFTRPYFLAPGVPADRVAALEDAFAKTMQDEEFLADAEKGKIDIDATRGPEVQQEIADYFAMPAAIKTRLDKIIPKA